MKKVTIIMIGIIIFAGFIFLNYQRISTADTADEMIKIVHPEKDQSNLVYASGQVHMLENRDQYAVLGGHIEQILVEENERVKERQKLLVLDTTSIMH